MFRSSLARVSAPRIQVRSYSNVCMASTLSYVKVRPALTSFSEEESLLRAEVARFANEVVRPKVREMDEKSEYDKDVLRQCFEQGYMGIETPHELGGSGMSFVSSCIVIEEMAKVDPSVSLIIDIQNTLINTALRKWGTEEQKNLWLPKLAENTVGSFALSEWGSGSDAFAMKTTATKGDGCWKLNGTKAWISSSKEAGFFLVMANIDPSLGYKGVTAFLVDAKNPGIIVGKKEDKLGMRASSTCEVILNDCVVHDKDVLGEVGKGYKIAIESLNEGRIGIGAQMLGLAIGAFEQTLPYISKRHQFGRPITSFQGMQFDIAKLATDIEAAKLLVYNAARLREEGKPFVQEASFAKLYASQMAERVATKCVEMLGGVGFTKDFPVEKFYRDCKIGQIYEGTTNIQYQTIAKSVLKAYE